MKIVRFGRGSWGVLEGEVKYAKMQGIKRSEVIRRAVEEMLKKYRGLDANSAGLEPH